MKEKQMERWHARWGEEEDDFVALLTDLMQSPLQQLNIHPSLCLRGFALGGGELEGHGDYSEEGGWTHDGIDKKDIRKRKKNQKGRI